MFQTKKEKTEYFIKEFLKCRESFKYFCRTYVFLELPGGNIKFNPYERQLNLVDTILKDKFVLVLKSRQIGISTIVQIFAAYLHVFFKNVTIGIVSKDAAEATKFARTIMKFIDNLPVWMKPKFEKRTERSYILSNGCKCNVATVAPNSPEKCLRGTSMSVLIIDEAAFIDSDKMDIAWTAMVPALSTAQMHAKQSNIPFATIILSTPNGTSSRKGKWFYDKYINSVNGQSGFTPFQIHWKEIPELANDPDWYIQQCNMLDNNRRKIEQELELKFISAEGAFFDEETAISLQSNSDMPIKILKFGNGEAWVFKPPILGRSYITAVDTAPENGSDSSAINIFDYETLEQVWEYKGKLPVKDFTKIVMYAASEYKGVLVVENNSYGNQVIEMINETDLSIMLYSGDGKDKNNNRKRVLGLNTNSRTRPLMIDALYSYITEYPDIIKSKRTALELIGLVPKSNGKVEAEEGTHDDLAMTCAMAFYVRKYDPPLMMSSAAMPIDTAFFDVINYNNSKWSPNTTISEDIVKNMKEKLKENPNEGYVGGFDMMGYNIY